MIVVWSDKSAFSRYRMMLEKRMLEAWANGRLVLVKLDHSFLPVGVRDLPAIDATFVETRKLVAWPDVERAAREAMKAAQTKNSEVFWSSQPPPKVERGRTAAKKKGTALGDPIEAGSLAGAGLSARQRLRRLASQPAGILSSFRIRMQTMPPSSRWWTSSRRAGAMSGSTRRTS